MKSHSSRRPFRLDDLLHLVGLLIVLTVCVFPFYWMVAASLKQQPAILASTPQFFFEPTLQNYVDAFATRQRLYSVTQVVRRIVDRFIGAVKAANRKLFIARRCGDYLAERSGAFPA